MATKSTMTAYLNADTRQFQTKMDTVSKKLSGFGKSMKALGGIMAGAFAVGKIVEYGKEAQQMAGKLEGIQAAFVKLNKPGLLEEMRKSVKGTVNDMELMRNAVKAKEFGIPIKNMGKLMKFAAIQAQKLGESTDTMLDSLIGSMSTQSKMRLDNLGISMASMNKEMAKGKSFADAAFTLMNAKLGTGAKLLDTSATRTASWAATMDNFKMKVGGLINKGLNLIAPIIDKITNGLVKGFDSSGKAITKVINYFIDLYNNSVVVRTAVEYLKFTFKTAFEIIKTEVKTVIDAVGGLGKIIGQVLKGEFKQIPETFKNVMANLKGNFVEAGQNIGKNFQEGINNVVSKEKIAYIGMGEDNVAAMETQAQVIGKRIGVALNTGIKAIKPSSTMGPGAIPQVKGVKVPPVDKMPEKFNAVKVAADALGPAIESAFGGGIKSVEEFGKAMLAVSDQVVGAFIREGVASMVAKTLEGATGLLGPLALPIAAAAGAGALALFHSVVPKMAAGGLAYGPTLAMVGDNPGARTDPEVIAPLSKLQGMQTKVVVVGKLGISMGELRLAIEEANDHYYETH